MVGQDVGSSAMTEERGREAIPNQGKKRLDDSKPRGEGAWEQVLAEVAERMEKSEHTVETLEGHVLSEIDAMKEEIQGLQGLIITRDDRIAQLEGLVLSLQTCIEGMREDLNLCKRVTSNEGEGSYYRAPKVELPKPKGFGHVLSEIDSMKEEIQGQGSIITRDDRIAQLEGLVLSLQTCIEGMREDLNLCKRVTSNEGEGSYYRAPKVELPKPKGFGCKRDAKEVENFLWQMEVYFESLNMRDETTKVRTANLYLTDTATLWWRRKHEDMEKGLCQVNTWAKFSKELKHHFYPENVVYEARKKLRELKHRTMIPDYVRDFTTLVLKIPKMDEEDLMFHFVDGLQHWAKQELQLRELKTLDDTIAACETLTEYQRNTDGTKPKKDTNSSIKGGGEKKEFKKKFFQSKSNDKRPMDKRNDYEEKKKSFVPKGGCFVCKGPHAMSSCPKLASLSAILEGGEATEDEAWNMGSVQLLNALKAKPLPTTPTKGLMYVEAKVNGQTTKAMVDTGATHNFITEREAKRLGLHVTQGAGWIKTVNASAQRLNGIVKNVELSLGTWKGCVDLSVAPLDDINFVLGMDFLRKVSAIPMTYLDSMCIMERGAPCWGSGSRPRQGSGRT
ncbi:hypothetical protein F511_09508 [Dorcoceras hygrometricum]|uniref:Ty3 transposon capsid-like protein domain-containing protein n=1 Tax=Dorcoceras hygrometricum TaxID=472368 RepID=A0A2Z7BU91_9LAMI|nr:hypothetical protein F511_09508 [Dorcoceras hygrometricum]